MSKRPQLSTPHQTAFKFPRTERGGSCSNLNHFHSDSVELQVPPPVAVALASWGSTFGPHLSDSEPQVERSDRVFSWNVCDTCKFAPTVDRALRQ
jgi:hypothetical protein